MNEKRKNFSDSRSKFGFVTRTAGKKGPEEKNAQEGMAKRPERKKRDKSSFRDKNRKLERPLVVLPEWPARCLEKVCPFFP
jgi:hypothetical protein